MPPFKSKEKGRLESRRKKTRCKDQQSNPIGTEDRATLERLERAGKLTYLDEDTRRRYEAMKRAGLFG
jgi:hypothetical protein